MVTIKNKEQLIENGGTKSNRKARTFTLRSLESGLDTVDPKRLMQSKLSLKNSVLKANGYSFDLREKKNIYVVGGGKASGLMAEVLEEKLGKYITEGIVNIPHGNPPVTDIIQLNEASHPIPDKKGVEGTRRMLRIAQKAEKDDLLVCLISGGGSSLMPQPRGGITLDDKKKITDALLKCGATINEINTVRKHISDFKGGWLAKKAHPAAVLNLILSDVVGDPLEFIASGPTVPDSTTFTDAVQVLKKYGLWHRTPEAVTKVLSEGEKGLIAETPKASDKTFQRVYTVVVGNNRLASLSTCELLGSSGLNTLLLTSTLEGEARYVGMVLASIAREVSVSDNPVSKPAGIVAGGETTVTVTGKGLGGRNQEIALAAAQKIRDMDGVVVASLSTDGVDGPTDAAGAIVDGKTMSRAENMNMKADRFLAKNDTYHFFSPLDDLIFTGPTGTNVNDISVIVVL